MADKKPMVGWYDPRQLVPTAVRAAVSTVFGEFADRREAVAAARLIDPRAIDPAHDYSAQAGEEGFWLDFAADTGDGWDSTYAMARLLAAGDIAVKTAGADVALPRGRVLVLGGDQVYPAATRAAYKQRFVAPFETAYRTLPPGEKWASADAPDVYAIPGNHDWYDGLQSFLGVFCRRRLASEWVAPRAGQVIGGRCTQQTRSYFALKLPQNWWLCGLDIQLEGYIDQPQVDFFTHVAKRWMTEGVGKTANIILCTGAPEWLYATGKYPDSFRNLDYLESVLTRPGHQLRLVLTGDTHHYNRYVDDIAEHAAKVEDATHKRHYITAGGGGAFLHPTHHLRKTNAFAITFMERGEEARSERAFTLATKEGGRSHARYPGAMTSRLLSLGDLFFALLNPWYTLTLFAAFALYTWALDAVARGGGATLGETLATPFGVNTGSDVVSALLVAGASWPAAQAAFSYLAIVFQSPGPAILAAGALGGTIYLAACRTWGARVALGTLHALVQLAVVIAVTIALARFWPWRWLAEALGTSGDWLGNPLFIVAAAAASAIVAATVMGVYLLLCLSLGGIHWNEAFSALRIDGYKNLLRLHIAPDGTLRVYPIGLRKVPEDHGRTPRNPALEPHLIEGPIVIPHGTKPATAATEPVAPPIETPNAATSPPPAAPASLTSPIGWA